MLQGFKTFASEQTGATYITVAESNDITISYRNIDNAAYRVRIQYNGYEKKAQLTVLRGYLKKTDCWSFPTHDHLSIVITKQELSQALGDAMQAMVRFIGWEFGIG